jgi:3-isopropylmalate/(R)-2-methylmalate dehydratase small subunit
VALDPEAHARLRARPEGEITIDLREQSVRLPDGTSAGFAVDAFARHRLRNGIDTLDFLLTQEPLIAAYEAARRSDQSEPGRFRS